MASLFSSFHAHCTELIDDSVRAVGEEIEPRGCGWKRSGTDGFRANFSERRKPPMEKERGEEGKWRRFTKQAEKEGSYERPTRKREERMKREKGVEEGDDGNIAAAAAAERKWKRARWVAKGKKNISRWQERRKRRRQES